MIYDHAAPVQTSYNRLHRSTNVDLTMPPRAPRHRFAFLWLALLGITLMGVIALILLIRRPWEVSANPAPQFLPGTRPIVFMSNRDGDWDLYRLSPDTRTLVSLTEHDDGADDGFPAYSADGGAITFLSNRTRRADAQLDGFMMDADGANIRLLQNDLATIFSVLTSGRIDWDVIYSPSGQRAFITLRDLNLEVYAGMPGEARNLSANGAVDWFPAWSPDGTRLAFSSDRDGDQEIYVINADGTELTRLTEHSTDDMYPAWTADGAAIIFYSERDQPLDGGALALYRVDLADRPPQGGVPPARRLDASALSVDFNYAPDGSAFVYASNIDGDWDIYYADQAGRSPLNLTDNEADDLFPIWQPDLP